MSSLKKETLLAIPLTDLTKGVWRHRGDPLPQMAPRTKVRNRRTRKSQIFTTPQHSTMDFEAVGCSRGIQRIPIKLGMRTNVNNSAENYNYDAQKHQQRFGVNVKCCKFMKHDYLRSHGHDKDADMTVYRSSECTDVKGPERWEREISREFHCKLIHEHVHR
ncbi:hypothetical protein RB195_000925 [Necator americanus]|uniref:Protein Wnt n=1 Tax=Necator americanus TaxID=51031 RepID=A0ABR1DBZ3_NECAM